MNKLHLSHDAQDDLREIKRYIAEELENPIAAKATLRKITSALRSLQDHAFIGAPLIYAADIRDDYRYLVCGNYLAFYRVAGKNVYVDRVLYGRRDYLNILMDDLLSNVKSGWSSPEEVRAHFEAKFNEAKFNKE